MNRSQVWLFAIALLGACHNGAKPPALAKPHPGSGSCPSGETRCGTLCADLMTSVANCGTCGTACSTSQVCQSGHCVMAMANGGCPMGQTSCDGLTCTDTSSDAQNCGSCGFSCGMGGKCSSGQCSGGVGGGCPPGELQCSSGCTDTTSDPANCGACGTACAAGQSCVNSACTGGNNGGGSDGGVVADNDAGTVNTGGGGGCAGILTCIGACQMGDRTCRTNCINAASPQSQQLYQAIGMCTAMACPNSNGGVCDRMSASYSSSACHMCRTMAQSTTCAPQVQACQGDSGGNTGNGGVDAGTVTGGNDGGTVTGDDGGANNGGMTGCNGAVACLNNCQDQTCAQACIDNTTTQGQSLLQSLTGCLESACPSTGGGICDSSSFNYDQNACDTCYSDAQNTGGPCEQALTDCTNDTP